MIFLKICAIILTGIRGGKNIPLEMMYPLEKRENVPNPGEVLQEARLLIPTTEDTKTRMLVLLQAKIEGEFKKGNIYEINSSGEPIKDSSGELICWPSLYLLSFYRKKQET